MHWPVIAEAFFEAKNNTICATSLILGSLLRDVWVSLNVSSQDFEKPSKLNIRLSCSENNLQENNSSYDTVDLSDIDF